MTPTPEMIEAAAREMYETALYPSWDSAPDSTKDMVRARAEKALKAAFAAIWRPASEKISNSKMVITLHRDGIVSMGHKPFSKGITHFAPLSIFEDRK